VRILDSGCALLVIDVETTGLDPGRDRVVEIAAVAVSLGGQIQGHRQALVKASPPIGGFAYHGLRHEDLDDAPAFPETFDAVLRGWGTVVGVVGHNVSFDLAFLAAECRRVGLSTVALPAICTMRLGESLCPSLASRSLAHACAYHDIAHRTRHRALPDALATAALLQRYMRTLHCSSAPLLLQSLLALGSPIESDGRVADPRSPGADRGSTVRYARPA
jgi:DNA polymerase III epsilon subunit-like protein